MLNALMNVRFWEQSGQCQPPLTNLDLWVHGLVSKLKAELDAAKLAKVEALREGG